MASKQGKGALEGVVRGPLVSKWSKAFWVFQKYMLTPSLVKLIGICNFFLIPTSILHRAKANYFL